MNPNMKSTEAPPEPPVNAKPEGREATPALAFANLFHRGIVRFAEMEKFALDNLVQHNTDFHTTWTQVYKAPSAPAMALLDVAVQGIEKFAAVQKHLMELAVEQSALLMDASKTSSDGGAKGSTGISDMVQQATERVLAAEKTVLDFAAEQNAAIANRFKGQIGLSDTAPVDMAADSIRRGVDVVIESQRQMMDLATKPIKAAAAATQKAANA